MNHCGRPTCECYKRCSKPFCECNLDHSSEKPVQEDLQEIHRRILQEEKEALREKINGEVNCGCECHDEFTYKSHGKCCFVLMPLPETLPATPVGEGWEKCFDEEHTYVNNFGERCMNHIYATNYTRDTPIFQEEQEPVKRIKSFITKLLAEERETERQRRMVKAADHIMMGRDLERARIEVAVVALQSAKRGLYASHRLPETEGELDALGVVLKVVRGEDIKS